MMQYLPDRGLGLMVVVWFVWVFGGCGGDATANKSAGTGRDSTRVDSAKVADQGRKRAPEGVPVKVASAVTGDISNHVLYSTALEAEEIIDIYAQASGLVRRVLVEEGDEVAEGQVLVELVDDELKLNEAEAHLTHKKFEAQFQRKTELYNRQLLSKEDYEDLKINVEQTRIGWERAKLALAYAQVRAPVSGVIARRMVKLGDRIASNTKLYEIVNMHSLIAHVHVPGQGMRHLSIGQRALVTTDFLPDGKFEGRIVRISPVVDPASGTFKVTLEMQTRDGQLRPGMFISAHIVTATHTDAVLVSKRAVVYDEGSPHVFVVSDSTANKVSFQMGFDDTEYVEVLSGVSMGDLIVVVGQNGLKDNARVRIIEGEGLRIPAPPDTSLSADKNTRRI